jgi:Tfp pilus assembly protein PilF
MRFGGLFLFAAALPAFGVDQWVRLTTPHFELYTTEGEKRGRETVLYFETIRSFFTQAATTGNGITDFPVRIIAFKSEKQYEPYRPNNVAFAYYTSSRTRDYIVMQDSEPEHLPVAIHEYMHLMVHHLGLNLPAWLNEGWADLYSTLKPNGKQTQVGALIPAHVQRLQMDKWIDFDTLTSVDRRSPYYNESNRAGIFYAESWAFVHMLYLTPEYRPKFTPFVKAILQGKTAAEACRSALGKSSQEVFADLRQYFSRNQFYGMNFAVKLSKSEEEAELSPVSDVDSDIVLADLLATTGKREQAKAVYERLVKTNPDKAEITQSLGYLAWQQNDRTAAIQYFERAFAAGDEDPQMCFHLATLERAAGAPDDKVIPPLLRALKVRADYFDARLELAFTELNAKKYEEALAAFVQLRNVPQERAAAVFNGMAYADAQLGNLTEARSQAENARKWDRTEAENQQTDSIIRYLDYREAAKPPGNVDAAGRPPNAQARNPFGEPGEKLERVEGTAKSLDCDGKGARLTVQVGPKIMSFELGDPARIQLKHEGNRTFDFNCGPQKPFSIAIEYVPASGAAGGVAGAIRRMEF